MLKINKKVEYALMALKHLSEMQSKDSELMLISARDICDQFGTPFDTTAKVLQIMNNHEILKSQKGIKGGYTLNKNLKQIIYMQLVRAIEGKEEMGRVCSSTKGVCELYDKCNIVTPVEQLNKKLNQYLETLTIHELLLGTEFNHRHDLNNSTEHIQLKSEAL